MKRFFLYDHRKIIGTPILAVMVLMYSFAVIAIPLSVSLKPVSEIDVEAEFEQAKRLLKESQVAEARLLLNRLLRIYPGMHDAELLLGASFLASSPEVARAHALRVLETRENHTQALSLLSVAYGRMRVSGVSKLRETELRTAEIEDYQRILEANPSWLEVLYLSATQQIALHRLDPSRQKNLENAIDELEKITQSMRRNSPVLGSVLHQLGRAYKHKADSLKERKNFGAKTLALYEIAVEQFETAIEKDPNRIDSLGEIVLIHRSRNHDDKAIDAVRRALPMISGNSFRGKAYEMLGALYAEQDDLELASQTLRRAINLNPNALGGYLYLSRLREQADDTAQAEKILKSALSPEPNFIEGFMQLAQLYIRDGNSTAAIQTYQKLLAVKESNAIFIGMSPSRNLYRNQLYAQAALELTAEYQITTQRT